MNKLVFGVISSIVLTPASVLASEQCPNWEYENEPYQESYRLGVAFPDKEPKYYDCSISENEELEEFNSFDSYIYECGNSYKIEWITYHKTGRESWYYIDKNDDEIYLRVLDSDKFWLSPTGEGYVNGLGVFGGVQERPFGIDTNDSYDSYSLSYQSNCKIKQEIDKTPLGFDQEIVNAPALILIRKSLYRGKNTSQRIEF